MAEEQYNARGMFEKAKPPPSTAGDQEEEFVLPAMLPKLSRTPGSTKWAGPALGAHTDEVLREELGMDDAAIAALRAEGII